MCFQKTIASQKNHDEIINTTVNMTHCNYEQEKHTHSQTISKKNIPLLFFSYKKTRMNEKEKQIQNGKTMSAQTHTHTLDFYHRICWAKKNWHKCMSATLMPALHIKCVNKHSKKKEPTKSKNKTNEMDQPFCSRNYKCFSRWHFCFVYK